MFNVYLFHKILSSTSHLFIAHGPTYIFSVSYMVNEDTLVGGI